MTAYGGITGHYIPAASERIPLSVTVMLRYAPLVEHLIGALMLPVLTQYALFFDMAGWHTDTGHAMPSVKIAAYLEPLDTDHGALQVLPGSHALDRRVLHGLMHEPAFRRRNRRSAYLSSQCSVGEQLDYDPSHYPHYGPPFRSGCPARWISLLDRLGAFAAGRCGATPRLTLNT